MVLHEKNWNKMFSVTIHKKGFMIKNILVIVLLAFVSLGCSSCNLNVLSHSYSNGPYDVAGIESAQSPGVIGDEDEATDYDDGDDSFWDLKMNNISWSGIFGYIFGENQEEYN